ncbi:DMT family transporter [Verrucomicrobium sp. BvORR106]|uniref:DMT family transporter n=1 Tax=Verrucomicrobium sp. BvORR106 TaxID=1403819 RepID=UPI00056EF18B|nr:DMT family transporter [Verrucomicrobium sp. BvORR106]
MPASTAIIVYPAIAALMYVFSALLFKRSSESGVGLWRTTFVANQIVGLLFALLWLLGGREVTWDILWQPGVIALCLFIGQLSQFLALEKGDVSVAVPIFGLKVVLVAVFTPLVVGIPVSLLLWIAAFLSVAGITLLNKKHEGKRPKNIGITLMAGGVGAVSFALFDVLVQKWGPQWGVGRLLPLIFGMNAVLSFSLILLFKAPLREIPKTAWKWLCGGSMLLGTQSIIFVSTVAIYGRATAANIIYASRGLLSVALVWLIGHWFANQEQNLGGKVLAWRMAGAALMMTAIVLVVVG